eukprot:scaffold8155_cov111-Isochrysis_galbana.AAC.2
MSDTDNRQRLGAILARLRAVAASPSAQQRRLPEGGYERRCSLFVLAHLTDIRADSNRQLTHSTPKHPIKLILGLTGLTVARNCSTTNSLAQFRPLPRLDSTPEPPGPRPALHSRHERQLAGAAEGSLPRRNSTPEPPGPKPALHSRDMREG